MEKNKEQGRSRANTPGRKPAQQAAGDRDKQRQEDAERQEKFEKDREEQRKRNES